MKNKWFVSLLMVVVMVCACWVEAVADTEKEAPDPKDFQYDLLADGTAEITDYTGTATDLIIPDTLNTNKVTAIRGGAFYGCTSLTSVTIPDSVSQIGENPFLDCDSLENIFVSLEQPYFASIDGVLFRKTDKTLIAYPAGKKSSIYSVPHGITSIAEQAFYECTSLVSVSLPDSVTYIGASAFNGCSSLTSIAFPDSITCIDSFAFSRCYSLSSVTLPNSITSIGNRAFVFTALTSVSIPDSVAQIGANPFANCYALKSISVSLEQPYFATIDGVLFRKADKALISYPSGIESTTYNIPQGIASINNSAFAECPFLTSVVIPDSVISIDECSFCGCTALTSISIPNFVTSIGERAFDSCSSLTSINIPDSVITIGDSAFDDCHTNLILTVPHNSYAAKYAKANNIPYIYPDTYDWLNN